MKRNKKVTQQTVFKFGFGSVPHKPTILKGNEFKMFKWQRECFEKLKGTNFAILNAPMGAGKTLVICFILAWKLRRDPSLKAIIAVPQTMIAKGFTKFIYLLFSKKLRFPWIITRDLTIYSADSNTDAIINFLKNKNIKGDPMDRVMTCTHQSMVKAFKKGGEYFKNVILAIDEIHHSKYDDQLEEEYLVDAYDEEDNLIYKIENEIGKVIKYALMHPEKGIRLFASTATFFRGDRFPIVPKRFIDKFNKFEMNYERFFEEVCQVLKEFEYRFVLYKENYREALLDIFKNGVSKTAIYIPTVRSRFSVGSKQEDVQEIYKALSGSNNPKLKELDNGYTILQRNGKWMKGVNLVNEKDRGKKKKLIDEAHDFKNGSKLDFIIALNMFKEGANWKWAQQEIIIGTKNSLTELIQIIGRLFRDAKGKKSVTVYHVLPMVAQDKVGRFKEDANNFLKAIIASMQLQDVLMPVKLCIGGKKRVETISHLRAAFPNEEELLQVQEEIIIGLLENTVQKEAIYRRDGISIDCRKEFNNVVNEILVDHEVKNNFKKITNELWTIFQRKNKDLKEISPNHFKRVLEGLNVKDIYINLINDVETHPLAFILVLSSIACGVDTFASMRKAISGKRCFQPFEDAKRFMEKVDLPIERGSYRKVLDDWSHGKIEGKPARPDDIPIHPETVYRKELAEINRKAKLLM